MHYDYITQGTCSVALHFDLEDGKIRDLVFDRGCDGNLKAIGKLVEGMEATQVAEILRGNTCGYRDTSCADQLARAIRDALAKEEADV